MKRLFIYINGILTWPGNSEGWTDRAVTWTHLHTDARAEKYEYFTGALTRRFRQQRRAEKLAKMISFYQRNGGWQIHLIGHSNGCDVMLRTLNLVEKTSFRLPGQTGRPVIHAIHLVSAACEADCTKNRLTWLLFSRIVGNAVVYVGAKDRALLGAHITGKIGKPFGLGYGSLGLTGPINPPKFIGLETITEPDFGHSTWFEPQHFDSFMKGITK